MSDIPTGAPVKAFIAAKRRGWFEFELYPQFWRDPISNTYYRNRKWFHVFFKETNKLRVPAKPGIYMFVVAPRHARLRDHTYIFYVGQATDLQVRFGQYQKEMRGEAETDRPRVVDFLSYFDGHVFFNYTLVPAVELTKAEDLLVDYITPWANVRTHLKAKLGSPTTA